ncbi:hypothetical protein GCM10009798_02250 [Nocardioides panacihumi]|uniref:Septum formation-related domain-containing protein n=1 Tax=Nocardioides panacihumi TaxID=400774 RepID=A0ABN2Q8S8_9ACTN
MLSRARTALVALAATLAAVLSVTIGLPSTAHAATSGTPKVGQCHQLTSGQLAAVADPTKPVRCGARHNLVTIAVKTSPTSLAGLSDAEHTELGVRLCNPAFNKALGRTATKRAMTAYGLFFFAPTPQQIAAGARWIRCDVGLEAGRRLVPLPKKLARPVVPQRLTDGVRRCLTGAGLTTTCSRAHAFRSISAFLAPTSTAYPTDDQFLRLASRRCPSSWRYATWPGPISWSAGDRAVVCYDKTRK